VQSMTSKALSRNVTAESMNETAPSRNAKVELNTSAMGRSSCDSARNSSAPVARKSDHRSNKTDDCCSESSDEIAAGKSGCPPLTDRCNSARRYASRRRSPEAANWILRMADDPSV
jgi:hypothetical protein